MSSTLLPPKAKRAGALREGPLRGSHCRGWPPKAEPALALPRASLHVRMRRPGRDEPPVPAEGGTRASAPRGFRSAVRGRDQPPAAAEGGTRASAPAEGVFISDLAGKALNERL